MEIFTLGIHYHWGNDYTSNINNKIFIIFLFLEQIREYLYQFLREHHPNQTYHHPLDVLIVTLIRQTELVVESLVIGVYLVNQLKKKRRA